ncbi:hypothetical protein GCM10011444_22210 [Winogradskyella haliclonae]|uniref:Uncharacterized protein n=1 Tax=Winogradskyella haliclonae TaxID=2048558 RepID=A0ABQ2C295_9FLAO|nr:hypothetical protein GCM10011444_22210 [Winogradskyella haliclonae]
MSNHILNTLHKWALRLYYARILFFGILLISFCIIFIFTDYKPSEINGLNIFLTIMCGLLGLILLFIGLFRTAETEYGIKRGWHKEDE